MIHAILNEDEISELNKEFEIELDWYKRNNPEYIPSLEIDYAARIESTILLQHLINEQSVLNLPFKMYDKGPSEGDRIQSFEDIAFEIVRTEYPEIDRQTCFSGRYAIQFCNDFLEFVDLASSWEYPGEWYPNGYRCEYGAFVKKLMTEAIIRTKTNNTIPFSKRNYNFDFILTY